MRKLLPILAVLIVAASFGAATTKAQAAPKVAGFPPTYVANSIMGDFNKRSRFEGKHLRALHVTCINLNGATLLCKGELVNRNGLGWIVFRPRWSAMTTSDGNQINWRLTNVLAMPDSVLFQLPG